MIDRGNKKWAGFMLSEHRTALRELYIEQQQEEKKEMDEHAYEEFNRLLIWALEKRREVEMTYYKGWKEESHQGVYCKSK
ncbi:YolD-like family protein [Aneurinibacillus migulanus]|uniref:YolD-like family protein n=1 Tax=Aneurinibacillus migulanus TaxID=47500 RepID=UPI002E20BB92|nr:YolD-like family protein [Aneurinibacillus migulanus]